MAKNSKPDSDGQTGHAPAPGGPVDFARIGDAVRSQQMKYQRFFDNSADMRFVTSRKGKLVDVNQTGVGIFRFESKEEMLGLDSVAALFYNPEDGRNFQLQLESDGFVHEYEVEMRRRDGSPFHASISANLWFEEDGSISCEGFLRDMTELRRWQEAFLASERQNRELTESEAKIRELNEHILNLLMIMSHDIRGPLVSIAATLKLLIRGSFGEMDPSVGNTIHDLLARVKQLLEIAEDFLGRARIFDVSPKWERDTIDLRQDIIDPVLDEVSNDIEQMQIVIDNRLGAIPAGRVRVNANKMWLKAVFRNLFRNAIKYGGRGCRIAFGFEDHGDYYRLNVYNSGEPIPEEHRTKLFTKFGRIAGTSGKNEGVGLGLFLIREIIQKHGGDIRYEAKEEGSDFILNIPK